jgi:hypothetical protein
MKGRIHIEVQSLVSFAMEILDSLGGATRSIFNVVFVW